MSNFEDNLLQGNFPQSDADFPPVDPFADAPPEKGAPAGEDKSQLLDLISKLRENYDFFSDMSDKEIVWILRLCDRQTFDPGQVIFKEGQSGNCFYLIVYGEVIISKGETELARMETGGCFGEMAILDDAPRSATARAAEKTLVFSIERDILADVFPSLGFKVAANLARQLSAKLRETDKLILS